MPQRKSKAPRPCRPKLVRVHMYTTAAGPDGVRDACRTYELPEDVAEPLIESGAAAMTEEQPCGAELAAADPKYPGPWSEEKWWEGISLSAWAEWRDPEAWAQTRANLFEYDDERKSRLGSESGRRLHGLLKADPKSWRRGCETRRQGPG